MSFNELLNKEEFAWLFENGLTIRAQWISPVEGTEYTLWPMGASKESNVLCYRKSPRACYNYAHQLVKKGIVDFWGEEARQRRS